MPLDPQRILAALVKAELTAKARPAACRCVITVSRRLGCGAAEVAGELAERLGLHYFDQEILEAVARESHVDSWTFQRLDDEVRGMQSNWLRNLLGSQDAFKDAYYQALVAVILGIARTGGVIMGRGANLVLTGQPVFRLRIVGSLDACAARVAKRESLDYAAARQRVLDSDARRDKFIRLLFGQNPEEPSIYDLTINSDHYGVEAMVDLTLEAVRSGDFALIGRH